jgi:hypothetical protein
MQWYGDGCRWVEVLPLQVIVPTSWAPRGPLDDLDLEDLGVVRADSGLDVI